MPYLQLQKVAKRFGDVQVVQEMDLSAAPGEFIVLVGASGCGKSTTLRMIAGLETPTSGRIVIDGRDVTAATPADRDIALVFQNYALYPHMNVAQNMSFALELARVPVTLPQADVTASRGRSCWPATARPSPTSGTRRWSAKPGGRWQRPRVAI
jgi:ABC-type sugar transport system ATPase subunit